MKNEPSTRATFWAVAAATAVGLALRLHHLSRRGLWQDETDFWMGVLSDHRSPQMAPFPGLVYGLFSRVWGTTEIIDFRYLSVALGTLAIPAAYFLGRAVGGRLLGAVTSMTVACSAVSWYWAQELRPYALFQFLTTLALAGFIEYVFNGRRIWRYAMFGAMTLSFATHLLAIPLAVAMVGAAALEPLMRRDRTTVRRFLNASVLMMVAAASGLTWTLDRHHAIGGVVEGAFNRGLGRFLRDLIWGLGSSATSVYGTIAPFDLIGLAAFLIAAAGALWLHRAKPRPAAWFVPLVLLASIAALYLSLGIKAAFLWNRYLVHLSPLFALLVAAGLVAWTDGRGRVVRVAAAAVFFGLYAPEVARYHLFGQTYGGIPFPRVAPEILRREATLSGVLLPEEDGVLPERILNGFAIYREDSLPAYLLAADAPLQFAPEALASPPVALKEGKRINAVPPGVYAAVAYEGMWKRPACERITPFIGNGGCQEVGPRNRPHGFTVVSISAGGQR